MRFRKNVSIAMALNTSQIKSLRAEGHRLHLKPIVTIGQNGLSDNVDKEIDQALVRHELLKLRIPGSSKPEKKQLASTICKQHEAELVEMIGNVIVIYRRNTKQDRYSAIVDG